MTGDAPLDLLVIGGGINGTGIARDAAGRGLSVMLVEKGDLAGATSSASSKLIHGGLRYLEQYEFRLVREGLGEREVLLSVAPHIIWPMTFVLPHDSSLRPAWMIRAGLFLYDHLARRKRLPASRGLDLTRDPAGRPLKPTYTRGFAYADCWVQDSRLVVLNALDASERGAAIRTRCRFVDAQPQGDHWRATLEDRDGAERTVSARIVVNAAGPWVEDVLRGGFGRNSAGHVRLVKGSHIVVPRLYAGEQAYILQNADGRIVFVIPYEGDFTLIGTTDTPFEGDPTGIGISEDETRYLCEVASGALANPVTPGDVVWSYAGVRPLYDDDAAANASAVTRDYTFDVQAGEGRPPLLSIYGGKITTYRRLAEHALEKLSPYLPGLKPGWTGTTPLPGGDMPYGFSSCLANLKVCHPWLPSDLARRLMRAYGTRTTRVLGGATSLADLGRDLGAGLTEREVAYLVETEWALSADDILWRRGKLGLHGGPALRATLAAHLAASGVA